ncbi:unnamed protein product [Allacma fusca]|uniref:Uncharacterized protein n=1 Tax=Allacma fusca TaxID=39272 RepID=A0A8J2LAJ4_9HEXA|nr:unnamed protein product [Allacma fusca]
MTKSIVTFRPQPHPPPTLHQIHQQQRSIIHSSIPTTLKFKIIPTVTHPKSLHQSASPQSQKEAPSKQLSLRLFLRKEGGVNGSSPPSTTGAEAVRDPAPATPQVRLPRYTFAITPSGHIHTQLLRACADDQILKIVIV